MGVGKRETDRTTVGRAPGPASERSPLPPIPSSRDCGPPADPSPHTSIAKDLRNGPGFQPPCPHPFNPPQSTSRKRRSRSSRSTGDSGGGLNVRGRSVSRVAGSTRSPSARSATAAPPTRRSRPGYDRASLAATGPMASNRAGQELTRPPCTLSLETGSFMGEG
jgi:hypothetical protein